MHFSDYAAAASSFAVYPNRGNNLAYPALGLCGEAGEVAEKVKKIIRDKDGIATDEDRRALSKELGDVLWYISQLAFELGIDPEEIPRGNLNKLASRKERGALQGSGDDR